MSGRIARVTAQGFGAIVLAVLTPLVVFTPTKVAAQDVDKALQERIDKEKAERRGCKVEICGIARNKQADGPDVSCPVVKTWTASELKDNVLKGKLDWPWSNAQCKTDIKLERKMLSQALAGGTLDAKLAKHTVSCTLDQQGGADKYSITFSIAPTVSFAGGAATKATLNWSGIEGSALAKGAVWSAATLDNNVGLFEGATVEAINSFFGGQCDEVKADLK